MLHIKPRARSSSGSTANTTDAVPVLHGLVSVLYCSNQVHHRRYTIAATPLPLHHRRYTSIATTPPSPPLPLHNRRYTTPLPKSEWSGLNSGVERQHQHQHQHQHRQNRIFWRCAVPPKKYYKTFGVLGSPGSLHIQNFIKT